MKKIVCLLLLVQSAFIIAQTKTVVTPYGEKVTININTVNTADNGLTKTDGNVQLGGTLLKPTTIETDADNTLAISNLQAGVITDDILVANAAGVLKKISSELLTNNWSLSGNAGTIPGTNFLGTTDDKSLMFKLNNQISGMLTSPTNGANTSFGYLSLMNPDEENGGISNSAFGVGSLLANTTGTNNTAMGGTALQNNKTGKNNAAIGSSALGSNEIGNDNTSMGAWALYAVKNGSGNTGVGLSAGYNVLGDFNTLIGYKSGFHIETGSNNIVIGANSTGDINPSTPAASNELNIGNTLFGTGINGAVGGTAGKIGVNINSPQAELDVNGQTRIRNLPAGATADKIVTADTDGNLRTLLPADLVPATTVSNTSLVNTLTTTVNDVTGTAVNIINSNTLTATNGSLISTINGVETTPAVSVLISANNGLTATNGNVQLDGALIKPTTITTDAANTLAVAGLQSASPTGTDNIVVANSSGVLSTLDRSILNNGWLLKGNAGTNPANNFLGTTDDQPLFFRINNNYAGHIAENNTSLGNSSLNPFVTGQFNTAMGSNSLSALRDGTNNTVTGVQNFQGLTSGSYNVAMGVENIGALTSGWNNIAIGAGNLSIETGNQNIAIGAGVGQGLLNGSSNILIGGSTSYRIDASGPNKSNEMNIGNALFGKAINSAIGTASIGINTNNPGNTFEVKSAAANTSGLRLSNLTSTSPATAASVATLGINATGDVVVVNSAPATTTNTLVATNGNLVSTVNGVASTPAVPVLISANNGLTATNGNVQLGGTLTQTPATTITTDATHTLAIAGLQTTTTPVTDNIILADPTTGVLKTKSSNLFAWNLLGNAGTNPGTNFLGTTDSQNLMFKIYNTQAGLLTTSNTSLGYKSLTTGTSGSENTAIGAQALALGGAYSDNTAVGFQALTKLAATVGNTAVGGLALANFTGGGAITGWNTAVGYLAMSGVTLPSVIPVTGGYNSAFGSSALHDISTGAGNISIGNQALNNITTGNYNIGIGNSVGGTLSTGLTTGSNNILIGGTATTFMIPSAIAANNEMNIGNTLYGKNVNGVLNGTTGVIGINTNAPATTLDVNGQVTVRTLTTGAGTDNIVVADPTTGLLKTVVSNATFWKTTGNGGTNPANNFIGTTDDNNLMFKVNNTKSGVISTGGGTGFGYQALLNGSGTTNTAFGSNTLMNVTGSSNVAIGYKALQANTGGSFNTAMGVGALLGNTSGNQNIAIGNDALSSLTGGTANANIALGYQAGKNLTSGTNNIAIGSSISLPSSSGNYQLNIGNAIYGIGVNNPTPNNAQIGINTSAPAATLHIVPKTIGTVTDDPMIIEGLKTGTAADNIIVADATTGVLRKMSQTAYAEPWRVENSATLATANTQNIYQNGNVGIGDFSVAVPLTNLDVRGSVRTGTPPATPATIGTNSFAGGNGTQATGANSFAFGATFTNPISLVVSPPALASGDNSVAFGASIASGALSFAAGNGNNSSGDISTSFGQGNTAGARYSMTVGQNNTIISTGTVSFAGGYSNTINASNAAAFGSTNTINGQSSVAMGTGNTTGGQASVAMGNGNTPSAKYSVAMGNLNAIDANSLYSVTAGNGNKIKYSNDAFAAGVSNEIGTSASIIGDYSTAFGNTNKIGTTTSTSAAFVAGQNNTVNGNYSAAIGYTNYVYDQFAVAMGSNATVAATHKGAFVFGDNSNSSAIASTASNQFTGMFNGGYRLLTNRLDLTKGMTMDVLGNVVLSGSITATAAFTPSDIRLKKDIQTLTGVLNNIKQLRGVTYYWKDAAKGT